MLRQFAQETGGRAFFPARVEDLKDVYGQIADELSSQYTIGYASKNGRRDGAWRRIVVQIARAERHRADQARILCGRRRIELPAAVPARDRVRARTPHDL